jgi:type I restriction enzyme S subunit
MSRETGHPWTTVRLGDVAKTFAGGTPSRAKPTYFGGDIPWLKSGELRAGRIVAVEETITELGLQESSARLAKAGTPVIAMYGATAGVAGILEIDAAINQAVLAVSPNFQILDAEFCYCLLQFHAPRLLALTQGSGQPNLSKALIEGLEVELPPITEQRRIAEILSSVDEAIQATQAVIEQTRKVRQGVLECLLTKGIGHTRFRQSEIGEVPEKWKVVPLQAVATVRTGLAKGKKGLTDAVELPYLRVANVQDGYIDLTELKTISVPQSQVERYSLQAGDVLMTEGGDFDKLGRGDVWRGQVSPCLHQNHVFAVRSNQDVLIPEYLAALTSSPYGKAYFLNCSKRTTNLASINSTQVKEFPVLLPPRNEQAEIVCRLEAISETEQLSRKRLASLKQMKSALMSDLLTGRTRVSTAIAMAAE